ncbi:hypothetical protein H4R21_004899 [Coemansia helicoidea]|uniref:Uncharacterized protein n=1 Tax=Coemansia helicoidea TaxID=1286919 RepID=A0ACC1KVY8_9FUNG|nr:hypothetical protein H4R21_004899 [Coemansia helicoidea]
MRKAENPTTSESSVQDLPPAYEDPWPPLYQAPAALSDKDPAPSSDKAPPPPADSGAQNLVEPPTGRDARPQQQSADQTARPQEPPDEQELPDDVLAALRLGRHPLAIECPWCHAEVTTKVKSSLAVKNVVGAVVVGVAAPPLFWVPLVMPGTHRRTHYCPQCKRRIGRGHRKNRVDHTAIRYYGVGGFI